jgi:hypothetical protein
MQVKAWWAISRQPWRGACVKPYTTVFARLGKIPANNLGLQLPK